MIETQLQNVACIEKLDQKDNNIELYTFHMKFVTHRNIPIFQFMTYFPV